jgi:predicted N-acetyltransferase YhbS
MTTTPAIEIREERSTDAAAIAALIEACYRDVPYSNHREHSMVERLRGSAAYVPQLSLVAEIGGTLAGHVMMTRIRIVHGGGHHGSLALAPLSIAPAFQRQGVGAALVEAAHERARGLGYASVILVGIAGYYHRFGYGPLDDYPISLPFEVHPDQRMALALSPGGLTGVSGVVEYASEWMEAPL